MNSGFVPIAPNPAGKTPSASLPASPMKPAAGAVAASPPATPPAPNPLPLRSFRPVSQAAPQAAQPGLGEPKITLERDGDRITKIKVQCVCGHVVELTCQY